MIRITTIFLCLLLAAAAAGRYRAEVSVREARKELQRLEAGKLEEARAIKLLRAEVAYLENPTRLEKIASNKTALRPSEQSQIQSSRDFALAFGAIEEPAEGDAPVQNDVISNAIAMAQLAGGQ